MGLGFTNEKDRPVAPIAVCHADNIFGSFADLLVTGTRTVYSHLTVSGNTTLQNN